MDLAGKIPFTHHRVIDPVPQHRERMLPGIRDDCDLPGDVRWENYAFKSSPGEHCGFMILPRQGQMLRAT